MEASELASMGPVEPIIENRTPHEADERQWSDWMSLANAGDGDAYRRLMTDLASVTESYIVARFGRSEVVDDCVQEVLLAVHRARATYHPARPFRPWFFTIVRNKTIDVLRRRQVRRNETPDSEGIVSAPERDPSDPAAVMDGRSVLAKLDVKQREALLLTKIEGYSMEEAATAAGVSRTAMKTRVHRALRSARKLLEREGVGR